MASVKRSCNLGQINTSYLYNPKSLGRKTIICFAEYFQYRLKNMTCIWILNGEQNYAYLSLLLLLLLLVEGLLHLLQQLGLNDDRLLSTELTVTLNSKL